MIRAVSARALQPGLTERFNIESVEEMSGIRRSIGVEAEAKGIGHSGNNHGTIRICRHSHQASSTEQEWNQCETRREAHN